jgi:biotin carboxyl carrier protein
MKSVTANSSKPAMFRWSLTKLTERHATRRAPASTRLDNNRQLEALNTARQSNQAIKSAQAAVEAARTQVGTAQQAVADTVVRAPFSGFISNRPVAVGEYVSSASVIATILRANPIKVQIQVAEADVPFISIGRGVSIEVDAYKDRRFGGTVTAVNPALDPTTRAAMVEAAIENNGNALRSGMFATVRITREGGAAGFSCRKSPFITTRARSLIAYSSYRTAWRNCASFSSKFMQWLAEICVHRPVFATVIVLFLTVVGGF